MIYYLDTKTLVEDFTNDHKEREILDCKFVTVSSRIVTKKNPKIITTEFYSERILFAMEPEDEELNMNLMRDNLLKNSRNASLLIDMMTHSAIGKETYLLLCSPNEIRTGYIKYLSKAISELFEYPVINYKKDKNKVFYYDPVVVAKNISRIEKKVTKDLLKNKYNRQKLVSIMTKKEMIKKLKKMELYKKGMSKSEMIDMLNTFFVDQDD